MSSAKITLFGIYKYMNDMHTLDPEQPQLFDQLSLPEGIDQDVFIYNTLDRGGEFEVLYADPEMMHTKVHYWSLKWARTFQKWVDALSIQYEPLQNYDRTEEHTRTPDLIDVRTPDLTNERTANLTNERTANLTDERTADLTTERTPDLTTERTPDLTDTKTLNLTDLDTPNTTKTLNGSRTDEKQVSAYDSNAYQPAEKLTSTDNARTEALTGTDTITHTGTDTDTHTGTDTTTETGSDTTTETGTDTTTHTGTDTTKETGTDTSKESGTDTTTHKGTEKTNIRSFGNIGVTTSQEMLEAELTISEWSLYDHLSDVFIREFCIPVYV